MLWSDNSVMALGDGRTSVVNIVATVHLLLGYSHADEQHRLDTTLGRICIRLMCSFRMISIEGHLLLSARYLQKKYHLRSAMLSM